MIDSSPSGPNNTDSGRDYTRTKTKLCHFTRAFINKTCSSR